MFNERPGARAPCISAETADAPRADDVPGQDEPDHPPDAADGEELVLEVLDVQVSDQVQAYRRYIPHTVPDGVRHVQHVLLVHVPVPRGCRRGQVISYNCAESPPSPPSPSYYYYYNIILILLLLLLLLSHTTRRYYINDANFMYLDFRFCIKRFPLYDRFCSLILILLLFVTIVILLYYWFIEYVFFQFFFFFSKNLYIIIYVVIV